MYGNTSINVDSIIFTVSDAPPQPDVLRRAKCTMQDLHQPALVPRRRDEAGKQGMRIERA